MYSYWFDKGQDCSKHNSKNLYCNFWVHLFASFKLSLIGHDITLSFLGDSIFIVM